MFLAFSEFYRDKRLSTFFVAVFSLVLLISFPKNPIVSCLWVMFCLGLYAYGNHMSGDHVFAACYAVSATHFGGWLYEIPFWHPSTMFYSLRYPWAINTQILSGILCVYLLLGKGIRGNKIMLYAALGYVATSLFFITKPLHRIYWPINLWWLPRIGVMVLLWSALTGIGGEKKQ